MIVLFIGDWRKLAGRGVAAVVFGLLTLLWPSITLTALVLLFGVYALVDGAMILAATLRGESETRGERGWLIVEGVSGIAAGLATFAWPGITALVLLYLIAAWAALTGGLEIATALRLRRTLRQEWLLSLAGVLSLVFAALLVMFPRTGALAITWLIGWYALVTGGLWLALAARLHRLDSSLEPRADQARHAAA
ncbi:MAG: hypothetical protein QOE80_3451 [Actinomycetota bacterium]|nr:hypothetical protein [Actinomycetota bacterium]